VIRRSRQYANLRVPAISEIAQEAARAKQAIIRVRKGQLARGSSVAHGVRSCVNPRESGIILCCRSSSHPTACRPHLSVGLGGSAWLRPNLRRPPAATARGQPPSRRSYGEPGKSEVRGQRSAGQLRLELCPELPLQLRREPWRELHRFFSSTSSRTLSQTFLILGSVGPREDTRTLRDSATI